MTSRVRETSFRKLASVVAIVLLASYPFSHFPGITPRAISPFQLEALLVSPIGIYFFIRFLYLNRNQLKSRAVLSKAGFWLLALLAWMSLSLLWASYSHRTIYFGALVWLGVIFACAVYAVIVYSKLKPQIIFGVILIASVLISLFAVYQFIGNSAGLSRSVTRICVTCAERGVSFPRSNGFSQEPEFFSFLLIPPLVISAWLILKKKKFYGHVWPFYIVLGLIELSFALGSSRGGLIAIGITLAGFILFHLKNWNFVTKLLLISAMSFLVSCALVYWSGSEPGNQGSTYTLERYISHVSAGVINIGTAGKQINQVKSEISKQQAQQKPGTYVYITEANKYGQAGSTIYSEQSRLETYKEAFDIWKESPKNILVGIGWGNFGYAANHQTPAIFNNQVIVNDQPLQFLLELGLVGIILFALCIIFLYLNIYNSSLNSDLKLSILLVLTAGLAQLAFFSAFHLLEIWFSIALIYYMFTIKSNPVIK